MDNSNEPFDEEYVREILTAKFRRLNRRFSRVQFYAACVLDINGGWDAEVDEAWRRYSASLPAPLSPVGARLS